MLRVGMKKDEPGSPPPFLLLLPTGLCSSGRGFEKRVRGEEDFNIILFGKINQVCSPPLYVFK